MVLTTKHVQLGITLYDLYKKYQMIISTKPDETLIPQTVAKRERIIIKERYPIRK